VSDEKTKPPARTEPEGDYQVWHRTGDRYEHALTVRSQDMLGAVVWPMISSQHEEYAHRVTPVTESGRPTTFGDVIVNPAGEAYEMAETTQGFVFDRVDFPPVRTAKMVAEQWEEVMAGVESGLRAGVSFKDIMREAGVYGVKPEEVAEIRKRVEQEQEIER